METLREHLISRGMNPDLYRTNYDEENRVITWFLHNLSGQITGYQQYRPDQTDKKVKNDPKSGRYYTHLKNKDGVFGLECLNNSDRKLFVVEGVFKASKLHRLGYNSIAVLSSTPKQLRPWFFTMEGSWDLIGVGDNDKAGQSLVNVVGTGFLSPLDLDDMTDENVLKLFQEKGLQLRRT